MPSHEDVKALLADERADIGITAKLAFRRIVAQRLLGKTEVDTALDAADRAWTTVVDRIRAAAPLATRDRAGILADVASGSLTPEDANALLAATTPASPDVPTAGGALIAMQAEPSAVSRYAELEALQLRALREAGDLTDEDLNDRVTAAWDRIREAVIGLEVLS